LIRAALELIARKGPAGFTCGEAARWAGVSPAAPYRHFRDCDELLVDVARRSFDHFEVTLARAWYDGRPDAFRAFDRLEHDPFGQFGVFAHETDASVGRESPSNIWVPSLGGLERPVGAS
jgi:AcrR family transcriptional regulator